MASAQVTAAMAKETVTAGPEKFAAALAPTEKIPAPTATATPMIIRSQVLSERFSLRPGSSASAIDCSMDLVRKRFIGKSTISIAWMETDLLIVVSIHWTAIFISHRETLASAVPRDRSGPASDRLQTGQSIRVERIRKRFPSGASTENPLPRPGTTSTVRWVWLQ